VAPSIREISVDANAEIRMRGDAPQVQLCLRPFARVALEARTA
jgi:hypothetical protein